MIWFGLGWFGDFVVEGKEGRRLTEMMIFGEFLFFFNFERRRKEKEKRTRIVSYRIVFYEIYNTRKLLEEYCSHPLKLPYLSLLPRLLR